MFSYLICTHKGNYDGLLIKIAFKYEFNCQDGTNRASVGSKSKSHGTSLSYDPSHVLCYLSQRIPSVSLDLNHVIQDLQQCQSHISNMVTTRLKREATSLCRMGEGEQRMTYVPQLCLLHHYKHYH